MNVKVVLTPVQIRLLLARLPEPSRSPVLVLVLTGMRIGEVMALRWRNVDLMNGLLHVFGQRDLASVTPLERHST